MEKNLEIYKEIALGKLEYSNNEENGEKDSDVIGEFVGDEERSYSIGFGVIRNKNFMAESVKSFNLDEDCNIGIFIYNCNSNIVDIIGKDIVARNKKNKIVWIGKIRTIPIKTLKFSEQTNGTCYIANRVINKHLIESSGDKLKFSVVGRDDIFSILNIESKFNKDVEVNGGNKLSFNDERVNNPKEVVSTELKHYIGDKSVELTTKILNSIIEKCPVEINNNRKRDMNLDNYIKIIISQEYTTIIINQRNDIETKIKCGKGVISLEKILNYIMN